MPKLQDMVINDGTVDLTFEPTSRFGDTATLESDAPAVNQRPRITQRVLQVPANATTRKSITTSLVPKVVDAETGEVAYARIRTEVSYDRRLLVSDAVRALAIHRNTLAESVIVEAVTEQKQLIG